MSKTTFSGPVRIGRETGAPSTSTISPLLAARTISLSAAGTYNFGALPQNSIIDSFRFIADGTGVTAATIAVGKTGDTTRFVGTTNVSAVSSIDLVPTSAALWCDSGAETNLVVTVGTGTTGGVLIMKYIQTANL